ncbi:hypothetical protein N7456_008750 [Penicillium angulare]|uniref:Protein kinase domain-containing protein n=1 Tax=Penicillium angulare TaxID=116970 RepID=A0A9W9F3G1_9EURO|nr:hypothetical protein N7456_008750 [Penicillium angulare]
MAHLHAHHDIGSLWWPEERIKSTLNTKYIVDQLLPPNVPRLFDLPKWGEGLTSETYMEYILLKAGRLFLILNEIGIPDRIFALVDESCDDDDLPIAEQNVDRLFLSPHGNNPTLDSKFFHTQWRFVVRGIAEGDHITYTGNEGVPVQVLRTTGITNDLQGRDETVDKVVLAGSECRVLMRTQVQVGGAPHFFSSDEVLSEIRSLRKLSHQHIISLYASYFVDDNVCVLFTGAETERTLHSFLTDEPPSFKRLPKEQRRQTLITWPHCLMSALSWLHIHGHTHGAIRPSNILIDADFHIRLGQYHALDSILAPPRVNDLESYQYSAPERWVRAETPVQPIAVVPTRTHLPSGGRTAQRKKPSRLALAPLSENTASSDLPSPNSSSSKETVIRIGLPGSPSRFSFAFSSSSSSSSSSSNISDIASSSASPSSTPSSKQRSTFWSKRPKTLNTKPSLSSISTTTTMRSPSILSASASAPVPDALTSPTRPNSSTPHASDIFSIAAIILDILTHLCKRSNSSFAAHRSARNRSAGRGGGMADASFHLARNAVQVQSWIALLEGDALKRCRRDRGSDRVFWAVPRMLIVLRAMLDAEAVRRPSARRVWKCFGAAIKDVPVSVTGGPGPGPGEGVRLCCSVENEKVEKKSRKKNRGLDEIVNMKVKVKGGEGMDAVHHDHDHLPVPESPALFDFGFSGVESDGDMTGQESDAHEPSLLEEEEDEDREEDIMDSDTKVDRVSPQLSLPDLDLHLTGIEGLTLRS